ncbi:MAG: Ig-like domain-containing protein, partial [Lachnospiraceae bacterium]|nr:Ig-like domain-containing protein [Lachnospiraceae bacterium]
GNTDYSEAADKLDKAIKAAVEVAAKNKLTKSEVSTAAEALNSAKATAEAEVKDIDDTKAAQAVIDKINELKPVENIKPEDRTKIEAAREAYKKLSDDQKTKLTGLDSTAVSTLEAAEQALDTAEKAAFDAEKETQKKAADALAADGDSDASKKLIEDAKKAIDALAYDETKSLDENKKAVEAILTKLKDDLTTQRAADKKEAEDTAAAKKVTDTINALPASDKVATTDKAAIEAARKAYDALTADQKKKVPADVLKKLTDAEAALKAAEAAEKAAKELEAAKKEAQAAMNEQVTVKQKGNKFTVKWKKSSAADGYYVYASYCGKKATKPAKTVKKNTTTKVTISKINGKKIKQKKNFHVYVVPYKIIDGKKVKLAKSTVAHLVGAKSTKYSNVKKLTLKKKKYTVKVGKTAKIKAKVTLVNKNKKHIPKGHGAKFRYKSSDTSIATVDKNGKIKGIKKGKCTIYVYSINGLTKKAKITVK